MLASPPVQKSHLHRCPTAPVFDRQMLSAVSPWQVRSSPCQCDWWRKGGWNWQRRDRTSDGELGGPSPGQSENMQPVRGRGWAGGQRRSIASQPAQSHQEHTPVTWQWTREEREIAHVYLKTRTAGSVSVDLWNPNVKYAKMTEIYLFTGKCIRNS